MAKPKKNRDQRELTFYFDYVSPFAFLAWKKTSRLWEEYDLVLKAEPILLGAVLKKLDIKGPAETPQKRAYTYKDVLRCAGKEEAGLTFPAVHPFNSLLALRATCLMSEHPEYNRFITHLFTLCWQEGGDINNPDLVAKVLKIYGIEDGIAKCNEENIKQMLKDKTEKALEIGVFGVPTMIFGKDMFWGNDRFEMLEDYIKGEDYIDKKELKRVLEMPMGVERKEIITPPVENNPENDAV